MAGRYLANVPGEGDWSNAHGKKEDGHISNS